ncbi:MAG: cbb3-type cytochrome oxidase assembly protein CcoS [Gemmatimonadales bacterium]
MTILFVLVPVALGVVLIAGVAFVWATRRGQFDDLETPALRILRDDLDTSGQPPPTPRRPPSQ